MEHLVIRTTKFLAPGNRYKMKMFSPGYRSEFTQSKVGVMPLTLNKLQLNDTIWLAESGYGVIAMCVIIDNPSLHNISNNTELKKFMESSHLNLQEDIGYWNAEIRKVKELTNGKVIKVIRIPYEVCKVDFPHFPLNINTRATWISLTKENKPNYFRYQNDKSVQEYLLERSRQKKGDKKYTTITLDVRNKIDAIWNGGTYDGNIYEDVNGELDHVVPQSVLGPGIIHENIVPVDGDFNLRRTNKIPISFFKALELFDSTLLTEALRENFRDYIFFNSSFKLKLTSRRPSHSQKMAIVNVIKIIRDKSLLEQRIFYLGNAILFYGKIIMTKYMQAKHKQGIVVDGIENDNFIQEILKLAEE